jgi:two-component system, OmpR family, alkaline phosphatase synthesis response regulator PhoP
MGKVPVLWYIVTQSCLRLGVAVGSNGAEVEQGARVSQTILVVEDDATLAMTLRYNLERAGYRCVVASDGARALELARRERPALVLLDVMLPGMDGIEVCRRLRAESTVPIIMLTAKVEEIDRVVGLEVGADDYVTKPFGVDELNARLRVALRRSGGPAADDHGRLSVGPLVLDPQVHEVRVSGERLDLTPREFEILRVLLGQSGRIVTKGHLLRAVWGDAYRGEDSYIYVHVSQLRRKLAAADSSGVLRDLIVTEPGVGYRIASSESLGSSTPANP